MTYEAWNAGKLPEGAEAVAAANVERALVFWIAVADIPPPTMMNVRCRWANGSVQEAHCNGWSWFNERGQVTEDPTHWTPLEESLQDFFFSMGYEIAANKLHPLRAAVAAEGVVNARAAQDERNWGLDAAVLHLMQVAQEWAAEPVSQEDRSDKLEMALRRVLAPAQEPVAWVCTRQVKGDRTVFHSPFVANNHEYVKAHPDHDWEPLFRAAFAVKGAAS